MNDNMFYTVCMFYDRFSFKRTFKTNFGCESERTSLHYKLKSKPLEFIKTLAS